MATIDKLDLSVYNLYAIRTKMVEQTNAQWHLEEASSIPPQIQVINSYQQMTELDILLGIVPTFNPWAFFFPPKRFRSQRRSPFTFSRIVPSISSNEEHEKLEALLQSIECRTVDEEKEKAAIAGCFKQISKINGWLGHIIGRIGQFLQA